MVAERNFRLLEPSMNHAAKVARLAVLWRLVHSGPKKDQQIPILDGMNKLIKQHKARIYALSKVENSKYRPFGPSKARYLVNCCPFGMKHIFCGDYQLKTCEHMICPHCWARKYCINTWTRLFTQLRHPDSNEQKLKYRTDIYLARVKSQWTFPIKTTVNKLRREMENIRGRLQESLRPVGSMGLFTVEPHKSEYYVVEHKSLLVLSEMQEIPEELFGPNTTHSIEREFTLSKVRHHVAAATEYPVTWMREKPEDVGKLIKQLHGFRRISFQGCLRKCAARREPVTFHKR